MNQNEYEPWTDTAAILTFIHFKEDYVMSESVRYNAEPNNHVIFFPYVVGCLFNTSRICPYSSRIITPVLEDNTELVWIH